MCVLECACMCVCVHVYICRHASGVAGMELF